MKSKHYYIYSTDYIESLSGGHKRRLLARNTQAYLYNFIMSLIG